MGRKGISKSNLFDDKRDGFFSISNLGSQWGDIGHSQEQGYYPVGGLFASMSQMGMGFGGVPQPKSPSSENSSSQQNNGMKIPCTEMYVRYVQSEGKVKILSIPGEEEDEIVEGVGKKKKGGLKKFKVKVKNPSLRKLISEAFAGAVSRTAVAPLETIRTHLMVWSSGNSSGEVFNNIMKTDGWKGLFRGNLVHVIRVAPSKAIERNIAVWIQEPSNCHNGRDNVALPDFGSSSFSQNDFSFHFDTRVKSRPGQQSSASSLIPSQSLQSCPRVDPQQQYSQFSDNFQRRWLCWFQLGRILFIISFSI